MSRSGGPNARQQAPQQRMAYGYNTGAPQIFHQQVGIPYIRQGQPIRMQQSNPAHMNRSRMSFQNPPPGVSGQQAPGHQQQQQHQNPPQPQTMIPNSQAALAAAHHHQQQILMQQHGLAYQMRPGYPHQNFYVNNPTVQWHHQGVQYQPQHLGHHGYNQPPPNHIPNQSQNPRPQTPPSAVTAQGGPGGAVPSVSTGGIVPGGPGVSGVGSPHPATLIGTGPGGQPGQQHQIYSAGSHTPAPNNPQFTLQAQQQAQQAQQGAPQPHPSVTPTVSVSTQQTVANLPNATGPGGPPGQPGVQVTGQPQAQAPVFIPRSQPPVKRERKGIQIIDPNTLQPIDITGDSTPTASVSVSRSSPASVVPNVDVSETRPNIDNEDVSEKETTPASTVEDTKTKSSSSSIQNENTIQTENNKQSSAEPSSSSRERTISVTSSVSENQQEVVSNSETKSKIIVDAKAPAEVKTNASDKNKTNNPLELASNSAIIHPASSSVSVEESSIEKSDSDIHSEDSKSKQRNKKDAVKPQPSEVPSNEKTTTIEPENNATSISEVANPQPSNTESQTSTNTVSIESKPPTAQNTTTSSDHSLNSSTVQKQQEIPSNHVESNHIISSEMEKTRETSEVAETTVAPLAEEMSKLLIEDAEAKAQAIENGNGSASSSANASKSSSQIKQKLKYDGLYMDDQWSPLNTEGKKQYGRDLLMALAKDPLSVRKPENLPSMDIIKDSINPKTGPGFAGLPHSQSKDWTPGFVKSTTSRSGMNTKQGSRDRTPGHGGRGGPPPVRIDLKISHQEVELQKAENAWKPKDKGKGSEEPEDPIKILERNVRAILNKLTPQKFDKLVAKFKELEIDTVPKLEACIELIFEKAVDEPEFSQAYARMCEVLSGKKVTNDESSGQKPMNFQRMMITRCQKEFERDYMEGFDKEKYKAALAAEESEDKRKTMQLEYEEKERRARRRSLGNIRFIGELYNLKMLTDRIMHEIIRRLVTQTDEESLECLCWLLNTIGKQLDQCTESKIIAGDKTLMSFDHYFGKMEGLVKDKKVPARVRFLIQDVIDLRKSNWIPRREKAGPKTLDQIHKEVEKEKTQQQLMDIKVPAGSGGGGGGVGGNRGGDGGNRNKRASRDNRNQPQGQANDDDWSTVPSSRSNRNENFKSFDPQKLQKTRDADNISLGPTRSGWGKGSGVYAPGGSKPQNRFAAADPDRPQQGGPGDNSANQNQQASRYHQSSQSMGSNFNRYNSRNEQRQEALDSVRQRFSNTNGPTNNVMGPSPTPKDAQPGGPQQVAGGPSMSMDGHNMPGNLPVPNNKNEGALVMLQTNQLKGNKDLEKEIIDRKAISLVCEYIENCDAEASYADVCSDFHPTNMSLVAEKIIAHVLESKKCPHTIAGQLLDILVSKSVLLPQNMVEAVSNILEYGSDMEIDIPKFWQYMGAIIAPMLASGKSLQMSFLLETTKICQDQAPDEGAKSNTYKYLSGVLEAMGKLDGVGLAKIAELWKMSGLQLNQFLQPLETSEFISNTGMDFLAAQPESYIKIGLLPMLDDDKVKNEIVFDWIQEKVPKEELETTAFIDTLTRVVTESQINGSQLSKLFESRNSILKRYINPPNIDLEIAALNALQHLMHKLEHPTKLLATIFFELYHNDVITYDGFETWRERKEPAEGKGMAIQSTVKFFTYLQENDPEEEEEDVAVGDKEE